MASKLNRNSLQTLVRAALAEDIGAGDATTLAVIPKNQYLEAEFVTREAMIVAGIPVIETVFDELEMDACELQILKDDGSHCEKGETIAVISGKAQTILTGERTALNFMQRLSGIATLTRQYLDALGQGHCKLLDTRKTTPGLRQLEKYAVRCGGGENHRFGLYDRIMIKDNHRQLANMGGVNGIAKAVSQARERYPDLEVEVEVDTLEQCEAALEAKADFILLDNMSNEEMVACVKLRDNIHNTTLLEASGGITIERLPSINDTGVDYVSVGALTHSARCIDIGLDFKTSGSDFPATAP